MAKHAGKREPFDAARCAEEHKSGTGFRSLTWLGIEVLLERDEYGDYILSLYQTSDGECVINVGLTKADVYHLVGVVNEGAEARA